MLCKQKLMICVAVACLSGPFGPAHAEDAPRTFPGSKISLAPLPIEIFMEPGERPAIIFSAPCTQIGKLTNGFPPIVAFETFMLEIIGKVNDSELLPIRLEPVCI